MIYFLYDPLGDQIKIGTTIRLSARLKQLEHEMDRPLRVIGVIPGSYADEANLHARFARNRIIREWFTSTPELMEFVEDETVPWDGQDEVPALKGVRLDDDLVEKAKKVAALKSISLAEYFTDTLRPIVDRDLAKEVRKLSKEGSGEE